MREADVDSEKRDVRDGEDVRCAPWRHAREELHRFSFFAALSSAALRSSSVRSFTSSFPCHGTNSCSAHERAVLGGAAVAMPHIEFGELDRPVERGRREETFVAHARTNRTRWRDTARSYAP